MGTGEKRSRTALSKYSVKFQASAARHLMELPKKDRLRIIGVIELLGGNPLPPKALKLKGRDGYRIRVGNYRIIYSFDSKQLTVLVIEIGHRKEIYSEDT